VVFGEKVSIVIRTAVPARAARFTAGVVLLGVLALTGCSLPAATAPATPAPAAPPAAPVDEVARVCDRVQAGPSTPPPGAVKVDPAVDADLTRKTNANPPGTTFWLAPGTHTLTLEPFGQVEPKEGDTYLGAPGAVLDGRQANRFAFIGTAQDVTIRFLTVQGFVPPQDQGVVNHDSGDGWIIEHNTIEKNEGAGLMAGAHQQVRGNCLRANGQYGLNAYQPSNEITGLLVEGNEITGNNTGDWETRNPGCGCSGGVKFWSVDGADVRNNWVHDNRGPGLWADTNNNDFLVEDNLIERNDGEALFYETSYNLLFRNNVVRGNGIVSGQTFATRNDDFPTAALYLSESGGEPRIRARTDKIEISGNQFDNNWSGITAWENSDRFCNSPANTSTGVCTRLVTDTSDCDQPKIASPPLYDDCRWKTQRVDVHDNTFTFTDPNLTCAPGYAGRMAILANYGTYPEWSPYKGEVVQQAIVRDQRIQWSNNRYVGPWTFQLANVGRMYAQSDWQAAPFDQDRGSTFQGDTAVVPDPSGYVTPTPPPPTCAPGSG
jgi:hypothetical protein